MQEIKRFYRFNKSSNYWD